MMYYAELTDHEGPSTFRRRSSIEKISRSSEMSLGLDDICDVMGSRDGSAFSMSCLEEGLEEITGGDGSNYFFNDGDEFELKEQPCEDEPGRLGARKQNSETSTKRLSKSLNWAYSDNRARKVRFSSEEPEIRSIPRADQADYPSLFFTASELQRTLDEFREEERNARRHSIR
mmetsp:Transcript_74650/g.112478  ORF Transcript_74650/g.112478 Transcript_74650/m.112478 type:complete len:173 (-) Transcript_74650:148-666(-)|eukprot:CAMPEP_0117006504 /NCGR_PEP_ID=MMETSP0472-20121206/6709_1 /TAXON_ID=693140 ORGANISM="Tiarina fusus, Strain LIS" /NCGR_SAMPLE_ID=MMETSP0472 /ASSEMBLY_ACC=CAM_ASM_000603 /LENGTH=172 /DNA_ID=CAMNT_0004707989 /DNA_START=97 /DNA_END=615 /DNA_ORIENTATION=+